MSQTQIERSPHKAEETDEVVVKDLRNETLAQEIDDILDDIDDLLEPEAEEFVEGFVQRGGE